MTNPISLITHLAEYLGAQIPNQIVGSFVTSWLEIALLLVVITFLVSFIKHSLHKDTYDKTLGRKGIVGSFSGAILGALTPVCSCSVTGLYGGLLSQGASVQGAAAFLFAAPAVNEFALAVMFQFAGVSGAILYITVGILSATLTGLLAPQLGLVPNKNFQHLHQDHVHTHNLKQTISQAFSDTLKTLKMLLVPVSLGVALSLVLGQILPGFLVQISTLGRAWYGPILATLIGLPTHIEAASAATILLPIIRTGLPLGTSVSLLMATTISSISEVTVLYKLVGSKAVVKLVVWYFFYTSILGLILNQIFH